jgi:molybdate transport system substrate-binding protein
MPRSAHLSRALPCRSGVACLAACLALAALILLPNRVAQAVELNVLAAGATQSTVHDMVGQFEKQSGHTVKLKYGAVGALRDRIYAGDPADLTIVTPVIIEQLHAKGLVRIETRTDLGRVGGGIAVRAGAPRPAVGTAEELKQALLAADLVYYADPATATAGAYLVKVADRLGVGDAVRRKSRTAPGGKEAMEMMAMDTGKAIGLTQISEIVSAKGVVLVAPYPGDLQVMTTYTGIVLTHTPHPEAAAAFLKFLMSPPVQERFARAGYDVSH